MSKEVQLINPIYVKGKPICCGNNVCLVWDDEVGITECEGHKLFPLVPCVPEIERLEGQMPEVK